MKHKLTPDDRKTLDHIRSVGSVWTITAAPNFLTSILRLHVAGLVRFEMRTDNRGRPQGSDAMIAIEKFVIADTSRPNTFRAKDLASGSKRYTKQLEKAWVFSEKKDAESHSDSGERVLSLEDLYLKT